MLIGTKDLTPGEKLLVCRRREGNTQMKESRAYKTPVRAYRLWESDERSSTAPQPRIKIGRLKEHEQCFLLRRRRKMTLLEAAKGVGVCRWWLRRMEKGEVSADRLVEYWRQWAA